MTRINVVPPAELCDQHLLAEYRELPRIFGLVERAVQRGERPDDPRNPMAYTLGAGHCRFFYARLAYLSTRFRHLRDELERRGFRLQFTQPPPRGDIPDEWWCSWAPDAQAVEVNRARIQERMPTKPRFARRTP